MFALGKLFFEWGNLTEAVPYLEDAVKNYPDAIQTADSHYYLAQVYLRLAADLSKSAEESVLVSVQQQLSADTGREREKALSHLQKTEELLSKRQEAMELTESEQLMLRNSLFGTGSVLMDMKRYDQAISTLSIVATHYQDHPEVLNALIQLTAAFRRVGKFEDASATLNQAEFILNRLEKNGNIPSENNWTAIIRIQRNLVDSGVTTDE
jgi:tetratricopeptide (TPR) repeat protein